MFELKVTTRVNTPVIQDTYCLKIDFDCMYGTTTDTFMFKNDEMPLLSLYLKFLTYVDKHCNRDGNEQYDAVQSYMANDTVNHKGSYKVFVKDTLYSLYWQKYKDECDDVMATIDSWTLTYFDSDGNEFNVEIINKGNENV